MPAQGEEQLGLMCPVEEFGANGRAEAPGCVVVKRRCGVAQITSESRPIQGKEEGTNQKYP